jgi:hypothetical protein
VLILHVLGIGNEVDHALVDGMAHAAAGASEFVVSGERYAESEEGQRKREKRES